MYKYYLRNKFSILIVAVYALFTGVSFLLNLKPGKEIFTNKFIFFSREMLFFLPAMFVLIGLADTWVSKEKVVKLIGEGSGIKGSVLIILLAMLQAGPLYSTFPVTYLLWKKGSSSRNIFLYLGAFSTIKLPLLIFEVTFLGWRFSIVRTIVTLPVIILLSFLMDKAVRNKSFTVNKV